MFKNHIKIVLRNALKNKGYTFINVSGLAIGIAICFLIQLWVSDELSYDRFHTKADRIYRVLWDAQYGDNQWTIPLGPVPIGETLRNSFPEVEAVTQISKTSRSLLMGKESRIENKFYYVDEGFFDVFEVEFLAGEPSTALSSSNAVVLTREAADRYFPNENPLEQTIEMGDGTLLQVKGVVQNFPAQSHFHFDFLSPINTLRNFNQRANQWGSATVYTYFVLRDGEDASVLEKKLDDYLHSEILTGNSSLQAGNYYKLPFQAMTDIHLRSQLKYELEPNSSAVYVYLFSIIGVFIIVLACINFVNLATARSMRRAKEVGIRKVLGSQRAQLIRQFLSESFLFVMIAVVLAITLAELVMPGFNGIVNKEMSTDYLGSPGVLGILALITIAVVILAGTYPALLLSGYRPVQALSGRLISAHSGARLRNGLVLAQFCISVGLIASTLVVRDQLQFLQNKRLGFDKERLLIVHNARYLGNQHTAFRQRLSSHPLTQGASSAQSLPGYEFDSTLFEPEQPANYENSSLTYAMVDENYVDVLGLRITQGRNFSMEFSSDSTAFLINESAAEALGWKDPIGKHLNSGFLEGNVVGVVQDFNFESLHHEVKPIVLPFIRWRPFYVVVRLQPGALAEGIAAVRDIWKEFVPQQPFHYTFLDEDYGQLYQGEQRMAKVFGIFSALAIVIACLGLLGLASYMTEQRRKEISIRKTLGATTTGVSILLTKDFVKQVVFANVLAWPIAWFSMKTWLQNFAYRIELDWSVFAAAGVMALVIALVTVSTQAIRAALADPAKNLRYE